MYEGGKSQQVRFCVDKDFPLWPSLVKAHNL